MKIVFENLEAEVDQNPIDLKIRKIEWKNLLITNENLIAMNRVVELEAKNSKLLEKIINEDHDTMVKTFSKSEVSHLNLQLKHQHLKENIENIKSKSSMDVPEFDAFFKLALQERLQNFKVGNEKVKLHYQELFNSIKITRVQTIDKTTSLQNKIKNLKTQLKGKMPCVTSNDATPEVPSYAKDTVDTLREIVKEARSKRPSDNNLDDACNDVVKRRNRTLVKAARTMLIFSKASMFLWAEVVETACYTQNRSLTHTLHNKTPYELVHDKKPDLSLLCVFGALCYPINDSEDLGKLKAKEDIGLFVGYAPNRKGYQIYNKLTRHIMETIHITFDELTGQTIPVQTSLGPTPNLLTPRPISSRLIPNPAPTIPYVPPTKKDLEILFQPMFDEYFEPSTIDQ
uniref:Retrovirus-related Pol polyprotein from transposon TNT 1-94 n=1 Tax=Tanacetum cinerariifolium TaxID=118510 RepID=A0A6L2LP34_TANCI|nr:retrovirus-related Pol polyprotein from transposon TNT 1-94 [Tanacetum cinerariifolium]